ncbi:glycerol-3-phosphate dehydrogenase protein-like isoform 2 [Pontoporia blainvillei]|uniref:Glycerol-3-phosphate dehydrogenase [NAD(+)] n=1 Tax=Pontoporia blainvillei TaxID=48723 RepID=A0ABX0S463_PONBL|nr:glycerol-3-phosphate dehydrogenase protein-like isoform 2 [Pontoporia blainvillei]
MAASSLKVCIVGSGNWGSAVAKIIGNNVKKLEKFASVVKMWVFEETVNGRKLTDIINNDHENVKYLPGHKLAENVVAIPNLSETVWDADLLVFVIPHQFIHGICDEISGKVPKGALGISLIKGIDEGPEGLKLISDIIREKMGIDVSVFMGANSASDVAAGKFCETTISSKVTENGLLFKELLQTPNFRITVVDDADPVELCGALKNTVAVRAGFCDGLRCGDNTKAAVIRLGLMEMIAFTRIFCKGQVSAATFLESCGVADLITTCYGGRNHKVAEAFARAGRTTEELEREMLNGWKLQGPQTSAEVYRILKQKGLLDKFPLFTSVYQICYEATDAKLIHLYCVRPGVLMSKSTAEP